ncbi:MAG TPA: hypothetical protein VKU61_10200, partial [Candidatus Binatia bacterium]|nr:hypothetical protein [Candidatus Binatia bacterium]
IGSGVSLNQSVPQSVQSGAAGFAPLRLEFALTDRSLLAGQAIAVVPSITDHCSTGRRVFLAYDSAAATTNVSFQCCLTEKGKCLAAKLKAAGTKAACVLGVYSKAAAKGAPLDTGHLATCTTKFSSTFAKAESGDCVAPTGGTAMVEAEVDAFAADLNSTEVGSNTLPSKCIAEKLKAAGKKTSCRLGVVAGGVRKAVPPDTGKLAACEAKFSTASQKADGGSDCGTASGNAGTVESAVGAFVDGVVTDLSCAQNLCP